MVGKKITWSITIFVSLIFFYLIWTIISSNIKTIENSSSVMVNQPYNVLLISIECLRKDHMGYYGYERDTTPNIDLLASESLVFEHAYSQAGWTAPSIASIFTSRYPGQHKVNYLNPDLSPDITTLSEILNENGYKTIGVLTHVLMNRESGFQQGFYIYEIVLDNKTKLNRDYSKEETQVAIENIGLDPFFMWIHYFDPHSGYRLHEEFNYGTNTIDKYDSDISFTDKHIGLLLEYLKSTGLYDRTIIILTADHGEEFMEHGGNQHTTLFKEVLEIPLIIRFPGVKQNNITYLVSQIDVAPTILKLLDIEVPDEFIGQNILFKTNYSVILSERNNDKRGVSNINQTHHSIIYYDKITGKPSYHMYDTQNDPQEQFNILGENHSPLKLSFYPGYSNQFLENPYIEKIDDNSERIKMLRELGYLN